MTKSTRKSQNIKKTLLRLWKYMSKYTFVLILILIFTILANVSYLYSTELIGTVINGFSSGSPMKDVLKDLFLMLIFYILPPILFWLQSVLVINIAQKVVFEIRAQIFEKLQKLPLNYFDTRTNGEIMSVVINSVDTIGNALNSTLVQIISSIITIISTLFFMIKLSPTLTLVNLSTLPIFLILTYLVSKFSKKYFKAQQENLATLNGKIEEIVSGQKVVKIFVREEAEVKEFEKFNDNLKNVSIYAQSSSGFLGPISTFINNLNYVLVGSVCGALVIAGNATVGSMTSFLIYSKTFGRPFSEIANLFNTIVNAIAGAEKVFELLDEEEEIKNNPNSIKLEKIKGEVEFKNVNFSYTEEKQILKNINLKANPSQMIALVGPTGAGKTTIINLLTRFYDINSGQILIDGVEIKNIDRDCLRSKLGLVLQDTNLFSNTIMENIRYANLNATDDEVIEAAKLANCDEFINSLPHGYKTFLKEDSDSLSQGQKQMLSIARTILYNPSILILDEATSNVDTRTEVKIQEAMNKLMEGRTSFVIAHRLSTIRNADIILVINNGEIIERGNHDELLEQKGFYYNLYMKQFANRN